MNRNSTLSGRWSSCSPNHLPWGLVFPAGKLQSSEKILQIISNASGWVVVDFVVAGGGQLHNMVGAPTRCFSLKDHPIRDSGPLVGHISSKQQHFGVFPANLFRQPPSHPRVGACGHREIGKAHVAIRHQVNGFAGRELRKRKCRLCIRRTGLRRRRSTGRRAAQEEQQQSPPHAADEIVTWGITHGPRLAFAPPLFLAGSGWCGKLVNPLTD
jgi:hypothetical protein